MARPKEHGVWVPAPVRNCALGRDDGRYTGGLTTASSRPSFSNAVVQIVTVGIPRFSSSTESWIHHDVQDPQSPMAVTTAPTSAA